MSDPQTHTPPTGLALLAELQQIYDEVCEIPADSELALTCRMNAERALQNAREALASLIAATAFKSPSKP